ncbi:hypothetical protein XENOCAPTIV_001379, partial [Xenoophorus captivus]
EGTPSRCLDFKQVSVLPTSFLFLFFFLLSFLTYFLCFSCRLAAEECEESQQKSLTSSRARPGGSASITSDDLQSAFLSPSPEDVEDTGLDFDLDAIETPSDSESLHFPIYDLDLEALFSSSDDLQRLGVASRHHKASGSSSRSDSGPGSLPGPDQFGLGALEREDVVDSEGTRWRCFTTGDPPQESKVNMSVLEPYLRVLSHGGSTCCLHTGLPV